MNAEMLFGLFGILVMLLLILFTGMSPGLAMLLVGTIGCISLMPEITLRSPLVSASVSGSFRVSR